MLSDEMLGNVEIKKIPTSEVGKEVLAGMKRGEDWETIFGHQDICSIAQNTIQRSDPAYGVTFAYNRVSVKLTPNDILYVAQYSGGRLLEGATELPEGATIMWYRIALPKKKKFILKGAKDIEDAYNEAIQYFEGTPKNVNFVDRGEMGTGEYWYCILT